MRQTLSRVAAPDKLPVDVEKTKFHLYIDYDRDDELVTDYIAAAVDRLDGPSGLLGRCLITQTWRLSLPRFPREIRIPLPRLQSVSSITYRDASDEAQALPLEAYRVSGVGTDHARINPVNGWPETARVNDAVEIVFVSGYGDDPEDVPPLIRQAILEMVGSAYENRETVVADVSVMPVPLTASRAVTAYTCWNP